MGKFLVYVFNPFFWTLVFFMVALNLRGMPRVVAILIGLAWFYRYVVRRLVGRSSGRWKPSPDDEEVAPPQPGPPEFETLITGKVVEKNTDAHYKFYKKWRDDRTVHRFTRLLFPIIAFFVIACISRHEMEKQITTNQVMDMFSTVLFTLSLPLMWIANLVNEIYKSVKKPIPRINPTDRFVN